MRSKRQFAHHPLLCWDIASQSLFRRRNFHDIREFRNVHKKFNWKMDETDIAQKDFDAMVITNLDEQIIWTSPGFRSMTGYTSKFAFGKNPSFLQGENTDPVIRQKIKQALMERIPIQATVLNYRKDGTEYLCQIEIKLLYSQKNELVNFLAFEKEIIT